MMRASSLSAGELGKLVAPVTRKSTFCHTEPVEKYRCFVSVAQ
jgi:hypothetical protein